MLETILATVWQMGILTDPQVQILNRLISCDSLTPEQQEAIAQLTEALMAGQIRLASGHQD